MVRFVLVILLWASLSAAQEKRLILHADDLGNTHATNAAAIELFEAGAISSASIMMPCPWAAEIAAYARSHPERDLGLHFTLTSEARSMRWGPVAGREKVPGLVDEQGFLPMTVEAVAAHATPQEVETELRAQIEMARKLGINFTHFDTHMFTLFSRVDFFRVLEKLGTEYGVPILRVKPGGATPAYEPRDVQDYMTRYDDRFALEQRMPRLDTLFEIRGHTAYEDRKAVIERTLLALQPGLTMIIVHPAVMGPELKAMSPYPVECDDDYRVLRDPGTRQLIRDQRIKLVGWRDLR